MIWTRNIDVLGVAVSEPTAEQRARGFDLMVQVNLLDGLSIGGLGLRQTPAGEWALMFPIVVAPPEPGSGKPGVRIRSMTDSVRVRLAQEVARILFADPVEGPIAPDGSEVRP